MQKRAPTLANILVIVLFALSCFGLLLFLWESFGGPVPLKPQGYRFTVELSRSLSLAEQSDVRISGVSVGHVISFSTKPNGLDDVTVEMDHEYAPVRADDEMILRQKTLLGETYIELLPKPGPARALPDGGRLPSSQVQPAVTLDDILEALKPRERNAFKAWQQSVAAAYNGRGEQINSDFAELEPFVEQANKLVTVLASQEGAVRETIHNTGVVFDALTERDNQFRGLVENGERSFHALAQSSQQFADAFRALPAFERGSIATFRELDSLAAAANPLLDQSRAWERELAPLLRTVKAFTPDFNSLLTNLGPLTSASKKGLPLVPAALHNTVPLLENVPPVLRNLDPLLQFAGDYIPEVQSFFANLTAATEAHDKNNDFGENGPIQHYLRGLVAIGPEALAVYSQRIGTNRANPYFQAGGLNLIAGNALQSFSTANCANSAPVVEGPPNAAVSQTLIEQLQGHVKKINAKGQVETSEVPPVANKPESTSNAVAAPPCLQQAPFTWEGATSQFPHVTAPAPLK
ncbi:MAG TPA: MlaD family protein [Solirubrobacteraceae bacterium]|jgi:phospholipid/cholesterol/gamma-HCH transport system substrate-binding protein|nr:MlaD family protein [Solirubrobacteraceae bacterium]